MNFYQQKILPWCLEKLMSQKVFTEKRREVLKTAHGKILEIGIGTGLNLPAYPPHVKEIFSVDVNPGMSRYLVNRSKKCGFNLHHYVLRSDKLPFPNDTFDTVISTWTLCSIQNLSNALEEIYRVLKPEGQFIFLEHGLSRNPLMAKWQKRLTPWWAKFSGGCHLDRDIKKELENHSFKFQEFKEFNLKGMGLGAYMHQGVAFKEA